MVDAVAVELTVVDPSALSAPIDLLVCAPPGTRAQDVLAPVAAAARLPAGSRLLLGGGGPLPPGAVLGAPPLVRGAVLVAADDEGAARGSGWPRQPALLVLHVVTGPDAGHALPLPPGRHVLGRAGRATLRVEDPGVSREHVELEVTGEGVRVRDASSSNGSALDGEALGPGWHPLAEGARLRLASTVLVLRRPGGPRASATAAGDGRIDVHRGPRPARAPEPVALRLPVPPEPGRSARIPVLGLVLPVAVAVPVAILWSPLALLFALTGPVLALGTAAGDRRSSRRSWAERTAEHQRRVERVGELAAAALRREREVLEALHPDLGALLTTATRRGARLWERTRTGPDALALRLGTGPVTSGVSLVRAHGSAEGVDQDAGAGTAPQRHVEAPVAVHLPRIGVLGICGPVSARHGLARSLLAQAAVLHSPQDLRVVVLAERPSSTWAWVRWLPHGGPGGGGAEVACGSGPVGRRVDELVASLEERTAGADGSRVAPPPWLLLVLDGARQLRGVPGVARLLSEGPAAGILLLCLEADDHRLPLECTATARLEDGPPPVLRWHAGGAEAVELVPDLVGPRWCDLLARALAPLRDATPVSGGAAVPGEVHLVDLLAADGRGATDAAGVRSGWDRRPSSTRVLLGATAAGPWELDLRRDGPHVLVAGTTGSGKSELLVSLVVALAVANRPDRLAVVLVDCKGGAAFSGVAGLPHAVGLVTDLDASLTRRALTSLDAEVRRREGLLSRWGCRDAEELETAHEAGRVPDALPRLLIVVDEFGVLAEQQPELLSGLVRLAAVGRSLGLHLVLATQRPAGVVSADIRANANLRIALRVRDDVDSIDVVGAPDAARAGSLGPGRAWARTGGGPLVEVQTARTSGRAPDPAAAGVRVVRLDAGRTPAGAAPGPPDGGGPEDLARVVAAVTAAAAGLPSAPSPWLPPLPDVVVAPVSAGTPEPGPPGALAYGWLDDPAHQRRLPLTWSLREALVVAGGPRSGRTAALRALGAALAHTSPAHVHLHVLQHAGGGLEELAALPHAAAVVASGDGDRALRLLRRLAEGLGERQRGRAPSVPLLVLLVDGAEGWSDPGEDLDGRGQEVGRLLQRLIAEGPAAGVLTVLAGGRGLLAGRLAASVAERLVLALPDPADHLLAGIRARDVPVRMPPGRAVRVWADGVHEVQVGLLSPDPAPGAQRAALAALATDAAARWRDVPGDCRPVPVPALPGSLSAADLEHRLRAGAGSTTAAHGSAVALGVGGDDVVPVHLDTREHPVALVAGPPGSGRTSTLLARAQRLRGDDRELVVVAPRRSVLTAWAEGSGVATVDGSDAGALASALDGVLDGVLDTALEPGRPAGTAVLVDDVELLAGAVAEDVLLARLHRAAAVGPTATGTGHDTPGGDVLVLAGTTADLLGQFRGLVPAARRARTGILLHPLGAADGELLGVRLHRTSAGPAGRATVVRTGVPEVVQLAAPAP